MFCDRCDRGWHLYCLDPPLSKPPRGEPRVDPLISYSCSHPKPLRALPGNWICPTCNILEAHVRRVIGSSSSRTRKLTGGSSTRSPNLSIAGSPLASSYGAWEAGANFGSENFGRTSAAPDAGDGTQYSGPMKASSPRPMITDDDGAPQTIGEARSNGPSTSTSTHTLNTGRRIRKPTNLDRTYEISSPKRSDSPAGSNSTRKSSAFQNSRAPTPDLPQSASRKGKERATDSTPGMIVRLKIGGASTPSTPVPTPRRSRGTPRYNAATPGSASRPEGAKSRNAQSGAGRAGRNSRGSGLILGDDDEDEEDEFGDPDGDESGGDGSDSSSPAGPHLTPSPSPEEDEEEESEGDDPFGGVIAGPEADTSKTKPTAEDKERFEHSKRMAEVSVSVGAVWAG